MLPHVAVIFLTGHAEIADSVDAMKAGAVDFLEEPVAEEKLFAAIRRAIKRAQAAKLVATEISAANSARARGFRACYGGVAQQTNRS